MAHRLHCQFLLFQAEVLIVTDELLVELSEGEVRDLEFRFDEFGKGAPGVHVGRHCRRCTVHADTGLHLLIVPVEKFEQGHLHARVTLEHVPDRGGIEILFPFHEGIEGRVYGKQQPLYFSLVSTASRLLPFNRLSRAFHSPGVQESLQLNCAIVRLRVIRPMIGALPVLSGSLFFR